MIDPDFELEKELDSAIETMLMNEDACEWLKMLHVLHTNKQGREVDTTEFDKVMSIMEFYEKKKYLTRKQVWYLRSIVEQSRLLIPLLHVTSESETYHCS